MNEWYKLRFYSTCLIRPIPSPMITSTKPAGPGRRRTARRGHITWFFLLCGLLLAMHNPVQAQDYLESQGIRFRLIPGGTYLLGSPPHEAGRYANEPTPHRVTVKPFYLAVTETTNAQYARFLAATGHPAPVYWQDKNLNNPSQPVVGVTWQDARDFCQWLTRKTGVGYRLPTEAEWEAAARGGLVGEAYPWGRELPDAGGRYRANYYPNDFADDGFNLTAPVGSFPANGYGLFDMAGNVSEWCADEKAPLGGGTPFAAPAYRVRKGGSWRSRARDLRCAARKFSPPDTADGFIGFRVLHQAGSPQ
jgi:formylglycine-generating enzyme required for sulfatase activity